jgi:hypothetical protein
MKDRDPFLSDQGEWNDQANLPEGRYATPSESDYPHALYLEGYNSAEYTYQCTGPSLNLGELGKTDYNGAPRTANEPRPHPHNYLSIGIDSERSFPRQPGIPFAAGNEGGILRGIEKYDENPSPNGRFLDRRGETSAQPYNDLRPSFLALLDGRSAPMLTPSSSHNTSDTATRDSRASRPSTFMPFEGKFQNSESAKSFRKTQTRSKRMPYRPPDTDSSIFAIEQNRSYNVERIYNAMISGDMARDNERSIAMKRWVHGAYYKSHLVEAYCHKVFDCLLEQAKLGYRGWEHNDYVADDRKGEDEDRDVDCAARLDNIIRALEQEKTICEDVMNSACQIRMFVNAPKAYANRKYQNRVGNSKRGRTKDAEDDVAAKPSKIRRPPLRPTTRARTSSNLWSSTTEARAFSHTPEPPQQQVGAQQMSYMTPPIHSTASPATIPGRTPVTRHTGSSSSVHPPSFGSDQVNSMSPPLNLTPVQRQTTLSVPQHSPFLSPPNLPQGHYSSPASLEPTPSGLPTEAWPSTQAYDQSYDPLFSDTASFLDPPWVWGPGETSNAVVSPNLFE